MFHQGHCAPAVLPAAESRHHWLTPSAWQPRAEMVRIGSLRQQGSSSRKGTTVVAFRSARQRMAGFLLEALERRCSVQGLTKPLGCPTPHSAEELQSRVIAAARRVVSSPHSLGSPHPTLDCAERSPRRWRDREFADRYCQTARVRVFPASRSRQGYARCPR